MYFVIIFIISFLITFANDDKKHFSNISKHLNYLVEKKIVEKSHISFIEKNDLSKEDIIYYLQKIVKIIDREKANQEDFNILENILGDISSYIDDFKREMLSNSELIEKFSSKIDELEDKLNSSEKSKEDLEGRIEYLNERLDKNLGKDGSSLNNFLNDWEIDWLGRGILSIYPNKSEKISYISDFNIFRDEARIRILNNSLIKNANIYYLSFKLLEAEIYFHSTNFKKAHFSLYKTEEFTTFNNDSFDKIGAGVKIDNTDIYFYNKDKMYGAISKLESRFFNMFSHLKVENIEDIKSGFEIDKLQAEINIPILSFAKVSLGGEISYKTDWKQSILLGFSYEKDGIDMNIKGLGILDKTISKYVIPTFSYDLDGKGKVGMFLNWNLTKSLEENDTIIEDWRLFLDYSVDRSDFSILASSEDPLDGSKGLAKSIGAKALFDLGKISIKASLLVRDKIDSDNYGFVSFAELKTEFRKGAYFFISLMKSNFNYYDEKCRFNGTPYSFLFYDNLKIDGETPTIFLGFDLEIKR